MKACIKLIKNTDRPGCVYKSRTNIYACMYAQAYTYSMFEIHLFERVSMWEYVFIWKSYTLNVSCIRYNSSRKRVLFTHSLLSTKIQQYMYMYCDLQNKWEYFNGFQQVLVTVDYWNPVGAIPIYLCFLNRSTFNLSLRMFSFKQFSRRFSKLFLLLFWSRRNRCDLYIC